MSVPMPAGISQQVTYLNHEFTNNSVKYGVVVVAIFGMRHKILDRLRGSLWKQPQVDIAVSSVQDGRCARFGFLDFLLLAANHAWLLVLYVTFRLANLFLICEHVESDFTKPCR